MIDEALSGPTRPSWYYRQSAAIPVRREAAAVGVLLVTSRGGRRWVVPKGVVEPGLSPARSAVNEAWEEAGVRGRLRPDSVGTYEYHKWGGTCTVEVFVLDVESVEDAWPEQAFRERRWMAPAEAAGLVREADLAAMLLDVA